MLSLRPLLTNAVLLGLGAFHHVAAQTSTDCNPTNQTGCPTDPAFGIDYNFNFNVTPADGTWDATAGTVTYTTDIGASFEIKQQGDSPTIRSAFYIFFGRVEIWMKAASGTGIISSMMLLSDDLDEIDWEILGGNGTHAETNYFGKGVQDYHNAIYYPVTGGTTDDYHNYTIDWTNTSLTYYIDGTLVRTLLPADANNTHYYPQTPMRLSLGIWAGGDPTLPEGTREWAGGDTDFTKVPFTMYVKSTRITDYSSGTAYNYTDMTGSMESIAIVQPGTNSTAATAATTTDTNSESLSEKFNGMSSGTKTAIYASSAGAVVALAAAALFYFIKQRKTGANEAKAALQRQEDERLEMEGYKTSGINPDGFSDQTPEYNTKTGMSSMEMEVPYGAVALGAAAGTGAVGAAAVSRPLLNRDRSDSQSSHPGSPHMQTPYTDGFSPIDNSHGPPMPYGNLGQQHAMPPSGPSPIDRSFSSPNAPMRIGSPAQDGFGNIDRMNSPGPVPQRSFTNPTGGQAGYNDYRGQGGYNQSGGNDQWR